MTNSKTKTVLSWTLTVVLITLLIYHFIDYKGPMIPAPAGIHGIYSSTIYNPTYKAPISKDALLKRLAAGQLSIKSGRLNSYDPPGDSLRYLIDNIPCDTGHVEAYIEFLDKNESQSTFHVLWFNAAPTTDDYEYDHLTSHYYRCFERVLSSYQVSKLSDRMNSNR